MLSNQRESQKKQENTEKQLEFEFNELKEKREKERKKKFNLPEHPLDNLLKDKKSWKKKT
jgi:hypothetical protein